MSIIPKRILYLIPSNSSYQRPIVRVFQDLGWQVKQFDYRKGDLPIRLLRFLPFFGGPQKARQCIDHCIIKLAKKYKPDLVLVVKGELLEPALLQKIKKTSTTLVNWFPDPIIYWKLMLKIAPYYDFFLHFDPLIVRKLRKRGLKNIYYLPFAAEVLPVKKQEKKYDISFVGTYSKFRENYLCNLSKYNLNIWGDPRWFKSSLVLFCRGGRVSVDHMKKIIQRSKVNINLVYDAIKEGTNLRTFEVTGSGGFLLNEYVKDLRNLFILDKEIVCFKDDKDLVSKIDYFLQHTKARETIASLGYKKARLEHNYSKRIHQLLRIVNLQ